MEKQSFLRNIKMDHVILEDYAKEIKACDSNVILYGAGCWAKQQYRMLQEFSVNVNAIGIDAAYYKPGMKFFDKDIQPIEELVKRIPNPVLWVGFNLDKKSYGSLRKELAVRFGVEKIYACDCAKYENFAMQNYKYNDVVVHAEEFQWLYDRLDEGKSKETFLSYLNQRVSGDYGWAENLYDPNHYFAEDIGSVIALVFQNMLPILLIGSLMIKVPVMANLRDLPLFVVTVVQSFLINWLIAALFGMIAFTAVNIDALIQVKKHLLRLLSGSIIPIWFFPAGVAKVLSSLPFVYIYQLPLSIYIGKGDRIEQLAQMRIQSVWLLVLAGVFIFAQKQITRKVMVQGG